MLEDSVKTIIDSVISEITYYKSESVRHESSLMEILTNLIYLNHVLEECPITLEGCREEAQNMYDLATR